MFFRRFFGLFSLLGLFVFLRFFRLLFLSRQGHGLVCFEFGKIFLQLFILHQALFTEYPAGSPGLEPREECGLSKFFNLGPNAAKPCT